MCSVISASEQHIITPDAFEDDEDLYARVFGKVAQQKNVLMDFTVKLDGEKIGEAAVFIGEISKIHAGTLMELLGDLLKSDDVALIRSKIDEDGFVDFTDLKSLRFDTRLNRMSMEIEITVPTEIKKVRNLSGRRVGGARPRCNVIPADISGFLRMRASENFRNGDSRSNHQSLLFSPVLNVGGVVLEGECSHEKTSSQRGRFHRAYTSLVYDWEEHDTLFRLGDVFGGYMQHCSAPRVLGIGISKDSPNIVYDRGNFASPIQLVILRQSRVEVYVNDVLVQTRYDVAPGTYNLDNITYLNGSNNIKIKIIDDTGREQLLDESFFYESSFLPKGMYTFNVSAGYPESGGNHRYDFQNATYNAMFRVGILSSLEGAFCVVKNRVGHNISSELKNKNVLGYFVGRYARSRRHFPKASIGHVYSFEYNTPLLELFSMGFGLGINVERYRGKFQSYLGVATSFLRRDDYEKSSVSRYRLFINNLITMNMNCGYARFKMTNGKCAHNININLSKNFSFDNPHVKSLSVVGSWERTRDDTNRDTRFSIGCVLYFDNSCRFATKYDGGQYRGMHMSFSRNAEGHGLSYEMIYSKQESVPNFGLNTTYSHPSFMLNMSHFRQNTAIHNTQVAAESSLFFANGNFAIAQAASSDGGFVIVQPSSAMKGIDLRFTTSSAESGVLGNAVISVPRHTVSSNKIDVTNLPDNMDLKTDTITSRGAYKRGAVADIIAEGNYVVRGSLQDSQGNPIGMVVGYAVHKEDKSDRPEHFFTNAEGHFLITNLKPGKYRVSLQLDNVSDFEIDVPESTETIQNIGVIKLGESKHE